MVTKDKGAPNELEKLNNLFVWWGIPNANGNGHLEVQLKRFQTFASEMQKTYMEAVGDEVAAWSAARERSIQAVQDIMHSRKPDELVAAEAGILTALLEETALQAKRWAALAERAHECCATFAKDLAKEIEAPRAGESKSHIREAERHAAE